MRSPRRALFVCLILLVTLLPLSLAIGDPGWLTGWSYRKSLTIIGSIDGAQTDYQIGIFVYQGEGVDGNLTKGNTVFGKVYTNNSCQNNFGDIRFTKADGTTELDSWPEYNSSGSYAIFWVEIDAIPESPSTVDIYVYYGTPGATATTSSMADTWTDSLDWTADLTGSFTKYEPAGGTSDLEDTWLKPTDAEYPCRVIMKRAITDVWDFDKYGQHTRNILNEIADDLRDSLEDVSSIISDDTDIGASGVNAGYWLAINTASDFDGGPFTIEQYYINDMLVVAETSVTNDWFLEGRPFIRTQQTLGDAPTSMNYWGYSYGAGGAINTETFSYDAENDVIIWGSQRLTQGEHYEKSPWMVIGKYTTNEPTYGPWGSEEESPPIDFIENEGIIASDSTVDDEQWFFLNVSIEIVPDTSTFLFNRIDMDPDGLNLSCSYTNGTGFSEENDPNNYLQLDETISTKTDPNNTFVMVAYYVRIHPNVTKDGVYNVTVYSTSDGLSDSDNYTSVFTLTIRAPSAPTLFFGAGFNASSPYVELHWTHDMLIFTNFAIQNSSDKMSWGHRGSNTTREFTDETVANGTERYYRVRACRDTGVGWKYSTWSDINFETVYFLPTGATIETEVNVTGAWLDHNFTSIATLIGNNTGGNYVNSTYWKDDVYYNVTEPTGAPGYDIRFNVTGLPDNLICICLDLFMSYDGSDGHTFQIEVWNFTDSNWDFIEDIPDECCKWFNNTLECVPDDYVQNGTLMGRFYHPSPGNINHVWGIDYGKLRVYVPYEVECEEAPALLAMGKYYAMSIILLILGVLIGIGMRRRR